MLQPGKGLCLEQEILQLGEGMGVNPRAGDTAVGRLGGSNFL